jgi:thiamine pyrophosphokinase
MTRIIIFANGELTEPDLLRARLRAEDVLIAADGGARHCLSLGLTPQLAVGDFDSLTAEELAALRIRGVAVEQHPRGKDETDLELALLAAQRLGATHIAIIGASGGRLDMTLANLVLLTHPALTRLRIEVWHGAQTAWLLRPPGEAVRGRVGDSLSLIPLNGDAEGVTTSGLHYPLRGETLAFGPARGVSNVFTEPVAQVALTRGLLLAVHTKDIQSH